MASCIRRACLCVFDHHDKRRATSPSYHLPSTLFVSPHLQEPLVNFLNASKSYHPSQWLPISTSISSSTTAAAWRPGFGVPKIRAEWLRSLLALSPSSLTVSAFLSVFFFPWSYSAIMSHRGNEKSSQPERLVSSTSFQTKQCWLRNLLRHSRRQGRYRHQHHQHPGYQVWHDRSGTSRQLH